MLRMQLAATQSAAVKERAADLARVNESLRTTVDGLAGKAESGFLRQVLSEAMRQIGSENGGVFVYDSDTDTLRLDASIFDGETPSGAPTSADGRMAASGSRSWERLLAERRPVVVEHHGFQTICPNGQLLIEPAGAPCPGHFMAGRYGECLRCNRGQGWLAARKLWLLTFVRSFLCRRVSSNITPTAWLGGLVQLPRVVAIPHGLEFIAAPVAYPASASRSHPALRVRVRTS